MATLILFALTRPLSLPDEGRYSDIGRWMFISGDWLVPRLNGIPFFHKPPLLYWLEAGSFQLFGVHVWAARLIPIMHAFIMLVGIFLGVKEVWGSHTAGKVTLVLGTSIGFLIGGQYISHDFLVATWITISIGFFALALIPEWGINIRLARLGFLSCALGFLSKGLIGVVLPCLVILIWLAIIGKLHKALKLPWLSGLAIFFFTILPWLIFLEGRFPGYLHYFIVEQHFSRFTGNSFNNQQAWWFYLPVISIYSFPWALFVIWLAARGLRRLFLEKSRFQITDPFTTLAWVWLLVILIFFSIPKSKLMGYILPTIAPMALLGVLSWNSIIKDKDKTRKLFNLACFSALVLSFGANSLATHNSLKKSNLDIAKILSCKANTAKDIYMVDSYEYDIPFIANLQNPVYIVLNWDKARKDARDDWKRTFFEGANFEPNTDKILQPIEALLDVSESSDAWLISPAGFNQIDLSNKWQIIFKSRTSWLWKVGTSKAGSSVGNSFLSLVDCPS